MVRWRRLAVSPILTAPPLGRIVPLLVVHPPFNEATFRCRRVHLPYIPNFAVLVLERPVRQLVRLLPTFVEELARQCDHCSRRWTVVFWNAAVSHSPFILWKTEVPIALLVSFS